MTACSVHGCDETSTEIFDNSRSGKPDQVALEWAVCAFHGRALDAGEPFKLSDDVSELFLGPDAPLVLLNFQVHTDVFGSTVTMMLGRDGIESQRVQFSMTAEQAKDLATWV